MRTLCHAAVMLVAALSTGCTTLCQDAAMPALAAATPCTLRVTKSQALMPTVVHHWTLGIGFVPIPIPWPKQISTVEMVPVPDGGGFLQGAAAAASQTTCQTQCQTTFAAAQAPSMYLPPPAGVTISASPPPQFVGPGVSPPLNQVLSPGAAPMPQGIAPLPPLK